MCVYICIYVYYITCWFFTGDVSTYLTPGSKWYNELGSVMEIGLVDAQKGDFTGTYCSAVGEATKTYELQGRFDTNGTTLGWIVTYKNQYLNAHSTCGWSGQLQVDEKDLKPTIFTTWLLTSQTDPEDNWNSTNVGFDTFTQSPPAKRMTQKGQGSHPKDAA